MNFEWIMTYELYEMDWKPAEKGIEVHFLWYHGYIEISFRPGPVFIEIHW